MILLDNYGNVAANPKAFDRWFGIRGHRVSTVPHSGQGWVVKQGGRQVDDRTRNPYGRIWCIAATREGPSPGSGRASGS